MSERKERNWSKEEERENDSEFVRQTDREKMKAQAERCCSGTQV